MLVKELINQLNKMNPDAQVLIGSDSLHYILPIHPYINRCDCNDFENVIDKYPDEKHNTVILRRD